MEALLKFKTQQNKLFQTRNQNFSKYVQERMPLPYAVYKGGGQNFKRKFMDVRKCVKNDSVIPPSEEEGI